MKVLKLIAAQLVSPSFCEEIKTLSNSLRHPYGFIDKYDSRYLLYAGGGEQGIDIASIKKINFSIENNLGVQ
jgi:hypothetical protein